jgi:hypothetical protein
LVRVPVRRGKKTKDERTFGKQEGEELRINFVEAETNRETLSERCTRTEARLAKPRRVEREGQVLEERKQVHGKNT